MSRTRAAGRLVTLPTRDYSVLSPSDLRMIRQRAQPPPGDEALIAERTRRLEGHAKLNDTVSRWTNTIASNRHDRETRLQREKEAEEARRCEIDREEAKIQALKRESLLHTASQAEFQRRPEVIAVNSQLLLDEVMMEREEQIAEKRRREIRDAKRRMVFNAAYRADHDRKLAEEMEEKRRRREAAEETARVFRTQKLEKETMRIEEKSRQAEADKAMQEALAIEADKEARKAAEARERARAIAGENASQNAALLSLKARSAELETIEAERRKTLAAQLMDEADERAKAEEERRLERTRQREKVISQAATVLASTKREQEDFLGKQLDEQYAKDAAHIQSLADNQRRLAEERRADYLLSLRQAKPKPFPGTDTHEKEVAFPRPAEPDPDDRRREIALKVSEFQRRQAAEKREREAADKERKRLEFQQAMDEDAADLEETRQYALRMLQEHV